MALMPKKTKSDIKLPWGLTMNKLIGIVGSIMIGFMFSSAVHKWLQIPFVIFCVIAFLVLSRKSKHNPAQSYYKGILIFFQYLARRKKFETMNGTEYVRTVQKEENRIAEIKRKEEERNAAATEKQRRKIVGRACKLRQKRIAEAEKARQKRIKKYAALKTKREREIAAEKSREEKRQQRQFKYICKEINRRRCHKIKAEIRELKAKI